MYGPPLLSKLNTGSEDSMSFTMNSSILDMPD